MLDCPRSEYAPCLPLEHRVSEFEVVITPRVSETDLIGHINNASIAVWFEDLRVRYMRHLLKREPELPRLSMTVASVTINYLRETFFGSDVIMSVSSVKIGNSSLTLTGTMHQNGQQVVEAIAVMVHWDKETRRPQRIGDEYRKRLEKSAQ